MQTKPKPTNQQPLFSDLAGVRKFEDWASPVDLLGCSVIGLSLRIKFKKAIIVTIATIVMVMIIGKLSLPWHWK